jgi:hypothetical protein
MQSFLKMLGKEYEILELIFYFAFEQRMQLQSVSGIL